MQDDVYLTVEDISRRLQIHEDTVRRWIRTGKLPAIELGGQYRISPQDFEEFLKKNRKRLPD